MLNKKQDLISQGRYIEAHEIKLKIDEMKSNTKYNHDLTIKENNIKHSEELEKNFNNDLKETEAFYDNQLGQFIDGAKKAEVELFEAHRNEMTQYIQSLDNKISKTVKFSKKYLDLKRNEGNAVKHDNLIQANYYKTECDKLEQKEVEEFTQKRNMTIDQLVNNLTSRQDKEKRNLKQKLDLNYEKIQSEKKEKLSYIKKKYYNQKTDLLNKCKKEKKQTQYNNIH